jgi:hypothetical protein
MPVPQGSVGCRRQRSGFGEGLHNQLYRGMLGRLNKVGTPVGLGVSVTNKMTHDNARSPTIKPA